MTKKPSRVCFPMTPYKEDDNSDPVCYSGPGRTRRLLLSSDVGQRKPGRRERRR